MSDNAGPWLGWFDRILAVLIVLFHVGALIDHYENIVRADLSRWVPIAAVLVAYVGAALLYYFRLRHRSKALRITGRLFLALATVVLVLVCIPPNGVAAKPKVSILIADLENYTDDQGLLRSGPRKLLAMALQQSPRITIVPQEQIDETLRQMVKPPETILTTDVSREICARQGVPTLVRWSIMRSGDQYVLHAQIEDSSAGTVLPDTLIGPSPSENLTAAIGELGESLRKKLGDSKFKIFSTTVPLPAATTRSLPALSAYFDAQGELAQQHYPGAKAKLLKALELTLVQIRY